MQYSNGERVCVCECKWVHMRLCLLHACLQHLSAENERKSGYQKCPEMTSELHFYLEIRNTFSGPSQCALPARPMYSNYSACVCVYCVYIIPIYWIVRIWCCFANALLWYLSLFPALPLSLPFSLSRNSQKNCARFLPRCRMMRMQCHCNRNAAVSVRFPNICRHLIVFCPKRINCRLLFVNKVQQLISMRYFLSEIIISSFFFFLQKPYSICILHSVFSPAHSYFQSNFSGICVNIRMNRRLSRHSITHLNDWLPFM